uniref:Uncharacterized protein n=1 Tax=viral metagenome TaxID=1070528 RepID=A0A6C0DL19_9ZZZZ
MSTTTTTTTSYNYDISCIEMNSFTNIPNSETIVEITHIASSQTGDYIYCCATVNDSSDNNSGGYIFFYDLSYQTWAPIYDMSGPIPFSCITTNDTGNVVLAGTNNYFDNYYGNFCSYIYGSLNYGVYFGFNIQCLSDNNYNSDYNIVDVTTSGLLSNNSYNILYITNFECCIYNISGGTSNTGIDKAGIINTNNIKNSTSTTRYFTGISIVNSGIYFALSSSNSSAASSDTTPPSAYIAGIYIFYINPSDLGTTNNYSCVQVINSAEYPCSLYVTFTSYSESNSNTYYDLTVISSNNDSQNYQEVIMYHTIDASEIPDSSFNSSTDSVLAIDASNQAIFYDVCENIINPPSQFLGIESSNSAEFEIAFTNNQIFITNNFGLDWYEQPINILNSDENYTTMAITNYASTGLLYFYLGTDQGNIWQISTDISGVEFTPTITEPSGNVVNDVENFKERVTAKYQELQNALTPSLMNFLMITPYVMKLFFFVSMIISKIPGAAAVVTPVSIAIEVTMRVIYIIVVCSDKQLNDVSFNVHKRNSTSTKSDSKFFKSFILWRMGIITTRYKIRQWFSKESKNITQEFLYLLSSGESYKVLIDNFMEKLVMKLVIYIGNLMTKITTELNEDISKFIMNIVNKIENGIEKAI